MYTSLICFIYLIISYKTHVYVFKHMYTSVMRLWFVSYISKSHKTHIYTYLMCVPKLKISSQNKFMHRLCFNKSQNLMENMHARRVCVVVFMNYCMYTYTYTHQYVYVCLVCMHRLHMYACVYVCMYESESKSICAYRNKSAFFLPLYLINLIYKNYIYTKLLHMNPLLHARWACIYNCCT